VTRSVERAVWSFWSKPYRSQTGLVWRSEKYHLLAWLLSVETARQHYREIALCTDDEGARLLVDGLGLEFDHVSTMLNALDDSDAEWWALGKLYTYRAQTEPFVHLDTDVFLWNGLPKRINTAPVLAQNPEYFPFTGSWYRPEAFDVALKATGGWFPPEWEWFVARCHGEALCCGIVGGTHVPFLNYYADLAIRIIEEPRNQDAWGLLGSKMGGNMLFEQYFLSACLAYHGHYDESPFHGVHSRCLFNSGVDAFKPDEARQAGYTHLIGQAKENPDLLERLEQRVARSYPEHYRRCIDYLKRSSERETNRP
jgi:hypothetical protein